MTQDKTYWVIKIGNLGCLREDTIGFSFTGDKNYATVYNSEAECIYLIKSLNDKWIKKAKIVKVTRTTKEI